MFFSFSRQTQSKEVTHRCNVPTRQLGFPATRLAACCPANCPSRPSRGRFGPVAAEAGAAVAAVAAVPAVVACNSPCSDADADEAQSEI